MSGGEGLSEGEESGEERDAFPARPRPSLILDERTGIIPTWATYPTLASPPSLRYAICPGTTNSDIPLLSERITSAPKIRSSGCRKNVRAVRSR